MAKQKSAPQQKPTPYVVLHQDDGTGGWMEFGRAVGRKGEEAIKSVAKRATGSEGDQYASGSFKAVPESTWESEGNQLQIESKQQIVTSFLKPQRVNGTRVNKREPVEA